jgi:hypothetical protein
MGFAQRELARNKTDRADKQATARPAPLNRIARKRSSDMRQSARSQSH